MTASLGSQDSAKLDCASPQAVAEHLQRLTDHFPGDRWLGVRNVYRLTPVDAIDTRTPSTGRDRPWQLGDYVAASCPLHLWDGWTYLGLAVHSHLCGTTSNAIHLAYYAELRAAMSLLASQGIGIFRGTHCVIDAPGSVTYLSSHQTHIAARLYLEHWADSPDAAPLLSDLLRMNHIPIADWIRNLRNAGSWKPLGAELLRQAGLDLVRMSHDRHARNEASYRPAGVVPSIPRNPIEDAAFVVEMMRLLEPGGTPGSFEVLDRFLCRRIIHEAYSSGSGKPPLSDWEQFPQAIDSMLLPFIDHPQRRNDLQRFLTRQLSPIDPGLLTEAHRDGHPGAATYHLQVLSRAALLLRLATGAVRNTLRAADIRLTSLEFWWLEMGRRQGFWDDSLTLAEIPDLWYDLLDSVDEIDTWVQGGSLSRRNLLVTCAKPIVEISGMARFALIGLAS